MDNEALQIKLTEMAPGATAEQVGKWINVTVPVAAFLPFAKQMRMDAELLFDRLFCLTCVDWKTHLTMVYHFTSSSHRHVVVIKVVLDRNSPEIESVSDIWQTANFHEREVYEMFGVNFLHHPDLRLLILPDGWEGKKPMLKDFEDPINMIRL